MKHWQLGVVSDTRTLQSDTTGPAGCWIAHSPPNPDSRSIMHKLIFYNADCLHILSGESSLNSI